MEEEEEEKEKMKKKTQLTLNYSHHRVLLRRRVIMQNFRVPTSVLPFCSAQFFLGF